jgi:asparagine synthase (glutamine-hydrolysing)
MCGIAGSLSFHGQNDTPSAVLYAMGQALRHRGPDECGVWSAGAVGLVAQRLCVVDLVTGRQPLVSRDGSLRLIANGEIYNADVLREQLRTRGHIFTTQTDIEVILHAYAERGRDCVEELEGMFAFAVWDEPRRCLFLARDRCGEKPLYYALSPYGLLFASEPKALLMHPRISRELDWTALAGFLAYGYVPWPRAIFRAMRKLPAAHWLEVTTEGAQRLQRYWQPPCPPTAVSTRQDAEEMAEEVLARLRASVHRRTKCDVPWGAFLSGGIDSSLVTALATEVTAAPVKTFAIGFEPPSYDERAHAASVAQALGTNHHELVMTSADARSLLPEAARIFDEPFADASSLPAILLSRLARPHITVALSGDGGDELFCGYPTQTAHVIAELYRRLPHGLRRRLTAAAAHLPSSQAYLSWDFALRRFLRDAARAPAERHLRWMGHFPPESLAGLLTPHVRSEAGELAPYADAYAWLEQWKPVHISDIATGLDLMFYLTDDNLVQADRASMSASLEVRAPFLDRALIEYAFSLPAASRRGLWRTKPLLRRAARALLPQSIVRRPKHGFGVPVGAWLRTDLKELARDTLAPMRLQRQGIFNPAPVAALLQRHLEGVANHAKELWTLVVFQLWALAYLGV